MHKKNCEGNSSHTLYYYSVVFYADYPMATLQPGTHVYYNMIRDIIIQTMQNRHGARSLTIPRIIQILYMNAEVTPLPYCMYICTCGTWSTANTLWKGPARARTRQHLHEPVRRYIARARSHYTISVPNKK